ncbi:MAG: ERF family protein [Candidatus Micrarchaeia archaeon]
MKEILKSLAKFHSKITCIPKTEDNPYHHSKYSGLDTVYNHIKKELLANGLWFYHKSAIIENEEGKQGIEIRTVLYHIDNGEELDNAPVRLFPKDQDNPQAWGSCITYAKRYSLQLALGLPSEEEDDDANKATGLDLKERVEYKIEKEDEKYKTIPYWMEVHISKINSIEELEKYYKENEKKAKQYGNLEGLIEACKKRKEEILKYKEAIIENAKDKEKKKKKIDIPERTISKPTREELINQLKYYSIKAYGNEINILDLFIDEEGIVPKSIDVISDDKLIKTIERLKAICDE